jgi:hypothetical protein
MNINELHQHIRELLGPRGAVDVASAILDAEAQVTAAICGVEVEDLDVLRARVVLDDVLDAEIIG